MTCKCINMRYTSEQPIGMHHNPDCGYYSTAKHSHIFYYNEGVDSWLLMPREHTKMVDILNQLGGYDIRGADIKIKVEHLTDFEINNIKQLS